jgi:APA family basic amino acid/polyamine antiporter
MGGLFPIGILAELVSIGTLMAFMLVCASVLVLRYTQPDVPRPFKVPMPWFTCLAGVFFCALMALSLTWATWARLIIWFVIGLGVYYFYSRHHSVVGKLGAEAR